MIVLTGKITFLRNINVIKGAVNYLTHVLNFVVLLKEINGLIKI